MTSIFYNFNENEWFILFWLLIWYGLAFRLPRAFPASITLLVGIFSISLAKGADHTLAGKPLDFYDTNEIPVFDVSDFATWFLYPVAGYLFIYAYHRLKIGGLWIPVFVLIVSALAVGFEWLAIKFRMFTYKDWTIGYSFPVYLLAQSLTIAFFHMIKKWHFQERLRNRS